MLVDEILQIRTAGVYLDHRASKSQLFIAKCVVVERQLAREKAAPVLVADGDVRDGLLCPEPLLLRHVVGKEDYLRSASAGGSARGCWLGRCLVVCRVEADLCYV
jgi:hypothetical protein